MSQIPHPHPHPQVPPMPKKRQFIRVPDDDSDPIPPFMLPPRVRLCQIPKDDIEEITKLLQYVQLDPL